MIGEFIVESFLSIKQVLAKATVNGNIKGHFYLPPLNRRDSSKIKVGTKFFGVVDDVTGVGALLVAIDDDFEGEFTYSIRAYDFKSGSLSFNSHIHDAGAETLISPAGPCEGVTGGPLEGV